MTRRGFDHGGPLGRHAGWRRATGGHATGPLRAPVRPVLSPPFVGRSSFIEGEIEASGSFRSRGGLALNCAPGALDRRRSPCVRKRILLGHDAAAGSGQQPPGRGGIRVLSGRNGRHACAHLAKGARCRANPEPGRRLVPQVGEQVHVAWLICQQHRLSRFQPNPERPHARRLPCARAHHVLRSRRQVLKGAAS
jgi:hypothetical protein